MFGSTLYSSVSFCRNHYLMEEQSSLRYESSQLSHCFQTLATTKDMTVRIGREAHCRLFLPDPSSDPEKKIFIGSSYVCEISTCFLSTNVETAEIYNRNGKRVYTSNCENMETSIFIIVSAESSRFPKLTQFFQAMLRLVCDTQYVSGKDTLFPFTNSPIHGFSQLDVVTCCDNRWRHCFVTSLHRWWTE